MVIRNLQKRKPVHVKHILLLVIIFLCVYVCITFIIGIINRLRQDVASDMYTLGASLTFSGDISVDNNFPNYTHSLVTQNGQEIGLKSSTINLNTYVGQHIQLVGRLKKYFKVTPILEVDILKFPDQGLILNGNKYLFVKDLVYLDFSTQPQLRAIKSGSNIQIVFGTTPVVSIERFSCSKIFKARDCNALITSYIQTNKDTFDSYRSYTFYKHGTGFWTAFDDINYGFIFKDISDDMILDISNMFRIVNKSFVVANHTALIKDACKNDFSQLTTIENTGVMTYHDPYTITLALEGWDDKKNPATCRITLDAWHEWRLIDVQYN